MSFVVVKYQTDTYSKNFSGRNYKRYDMLFKSLYHTVNYKMTTTNK